MRSDHARGIAALVLASVNSGCGLDAAGIPSGQAASSTGTGAGAAGGGASVTSSTSASTGVGGAGGVGGVGGAAASSSSASKGAGGAGGVGGGPPLDCQGTGEFFGGPIAHCYLFVETPPEPLAWIEARAECMQWQGGGGDLAALSSEGELDFVLAMIGSSNDDSWIGGWDQGNGGQKDDFEWSNGEPWGDDGWVNGDAPWKNGEPGGADDRLKLHDGFEGRTYKDTTPLGYVCERP